MSHWTDRGDADPVLVAAQMDVVLHNAATLARMRDWPRERALETMVLEMAKRQAAMMGLLTQAMECIPPRAIGTDTPQSSGEGT